MRTHSLYHIFRLIHLISIGQFDDGYLIVFKAICLSAFHACEMDVVDMPTVAAAAYAVLLLTAAVVNLVQQVMLGKKPQRTEDARPVHGGHPPLHVGKGESLRLLSRLCPHQCSYRRGLDAMLPQKYFSRVLCHCCYASRGGKRLQNYCFFSNYASFLALFCASHGKIAMWETRSGVGDAWCFD